MYKRLTISLVLMGLAAFSLAAGAVAWFSDGTSTGVTISAGTADLKFDFDGDCDDLDLTGLVDGVNDLQWTGVVPGDVTEDCTRVLNDGEGTLDVYLDHQSYGGSLLGHIHFRYWLVDSNYDVTANRCGATSAPASNSAFTNGRGCFLGTLAEDEDLYFKGRALFNDNGSNQNGSAGGSMNLDIVVTGYTG